MEFIFVECDEAVRQKVLHELGDLDEPRLTDLVLEFEVLINEFLGTEHELAFPRLESTE